MADETATLASLRDAVGRFAAERAWEPFHSPKNLAMGLAIEAAELMEHFLWIDCADSRTVTQDPAKRIQVAEEMADVACYLLTMCNVLDLDLSEAVLDKIEKNARKYPVDKYKGRF